MIEELRQPRSWMEIAVLTAAFYFILHVVRGTRGAGILKGVIFLFIVAFLLFMFLAERLHLENIQRILAWLLSGSALAVVVLFAPEIRRGLSHLAQSRLLSPFLRAPSGSLVDELADAAVRLSKNRIGTLVAIERDVGLGDYIEHGCRIDAALTSELLETIFYPGSALHDGAVVVQGDRVAAAACLLPLTDNPTLSKSMGTRHRAAIGISEETDAAALVVSEETGRISVAVDGRLVGDLDRDSLRRVLTDLYARRDRDVKPAGAPDKDTAVVWGPPQARPAPPPPPASTPPSDGQEGAA
jgi:diadenylate cyclase